MEICPTCNRPLPSEARYLTDRERAALSAWWWLKSTRAAAVALGLSEQTVKNQLMTARNRNGVTKTSDLAYMYMAQLSAKAVVRTSHKSGKREAA
jgi:DNA-binding CsgD family transcriptional regulator